MRHPLQITAALLFATSCVSGGATTASSSTLGPPSATARAAIPLRPPGPGISGCVESRELKEYVQALDASRRAARDAALAALGVRGEERRGVFAPPGAANRLGEIHTTAGQRFGVVAHVAPAFEPKALLAKHGSRLHRIDERPRAHPVPILVCGLEACRPSPQPRTQPGHSPPARPVLVQLEPGETLGDTLRVSYDYWWAQVSYDRKADCSLERSAVR